MPRYSSFSYNKGERLTASLIQKVILTGKSSFVKPFKVYWLYICKDNAVQPPVRMSVIIGKRIINKASNRNFFKRIIKESYRNNKLKLYDHIYNKFPSLQLLLIISYVNKSSYNSNKFFN